MNKLRIMISILWQFCRTFRWSTIPNCKIEVLRKQKNLTNLISQHVHSTPPGAPHWSTPPVTGLLYPKLPNITVYIIPITHQINFRQEQIRTLRMNRRL